MSLQNNFYTYEELQNFTNNFTNCSITNIAKFIETKTSKKYRVVENELMTDLTQQLEDNNQVVLDIKLFTMDIWEKVNLQNRNTINKWHKELEEFDFFAKHDEGDSKWENIFY